MIASAHSLRATTQEQHDLLAWLSHRLSYIDWTQPVGTALLDAGVGADRPVGEWAELPWYGPLELWLNDDDISDILLNGQGQDIVVVRNGHRHATGVVLHPDWLAFIQRQLLLRSGLVTPTTTEKWPADHILGTADRRVRFAMTRPPATPDGPTLSIRTIPRRWRKLDTLTAEDLLSREHAQLLVMALRRGVSVVISGAGGSGKTTMAAALLLAIGEDRRVVVIEECIELPRLPDSIHQEITRSAMTFSDGVRFALRQRPDLIVVGEVRGAEALPMLEAAGTGHPGIATIHAPDAQAALKNLERMACMAGAEPSIVRGMVASSTAPLLVLHVGRYGDRRRVGQIAEVLPLGAAGSAGDKYPLHFILQRNQRTGAIERAGMPTGAWWREA